MASLDRRYPMRALVLAVRGALAALVLVPAAHAADSDEAVRNLTQPLNSVEVGAQYVTDDSRKFGEYNGLDKKGGYVIGNIDMRGGDGPEGAYRWRVYGLDLGLDSRYLLGEVGTQGKWRVTGVY